MNSLTPAAQAIVEALKAPGLTPEQVATLVHALQALQSPAPSPAQPESTSATKRKKQHQRKADAVPLTREAIAGMVLPATGERCVYDTTCPQLAVRLRSGGATYMVVMWDSKRRRA